MYMKFSIVVPVYNAEPFLDSCIQSVESQLFSDWELILIDDGSSDKSGEMLDDYALKDSRIHVIHQENCGQFYARQRGISLSTGDYIVFLDSDDALEPECLKVIQCAICDHDPDIVLYTGRIFKDGADAGRSVGDIASAEMELSALWLKKQLISSHRFNSLCLKAFRRETFNGDTTDYSCFYGTHCGEDKAQLLCPVTNAKKIWYIPDRLYQYHQRTDSTMHQCRPDTISRMMAGEMFTLLYQFMQTWGMTEPANLEAVAVYYLKNYLSVYYNCRKRCTAKERQILRQYPWNKEIDKTAMRYFFSSRLTMKERAKLIAALARV